MSPCLSLEQRSCTLLLIRNNSAISRPHLLAITLQAFNKICQTSNLHCRLLDVEYYLLCSDGSNLTLKNEGDSTTNLNAALAKPLPIFFACDKDKGIAFTLHQSRFPYSILSRCSELTLAETRFSFARKRKMCSQRREYPSYLQQTGATLGSKYVAFRLFHQQNSMLNAEEYLPKYQQNTFI